MEPTKLLLFINTILLKLMHDSVLLDYEVNTPAILKMTSDGATRYLLNLLATGKDKGRVN